MLHEALSSKRRRPPLSSARVMFNRRFASALLLRSGLGSMLMRAVQATASKLHAYLALFSTRVLARLSPSTIAHRLAQGLFRWSWTCQIGFNQAATAFPMLHSWMQSRIAPVSRHGEPICCKKREKIMPECDLYLRRLNAGLGVSA